MQKTLVHFLGVLVVASIVILPSIARSQSPDREYQCENGTSLRETRQNAVMISFENGSLLVLKNIGYRNGVSYSWQQSDPAVCAPGKVILCAASWNDGNLPEAYWVIGGTKISCSGEPEFIE